MQITFFFVQWDYVGIGGMYTLGSHSAERAMGLADQCELQAISMAHRQCRKASKMSPNTRISLKS